MQGSRSTYLKDDSVIVKDQISLQTPILISLAATIVLLISQSFLTAVGLGWTLLLFLLFTYKLGKGLPVLELILVMAGLQWIVGAWIAYLNESNHWRYFMYVDESEYMRLAVPGLICFSIGIWLFSPSYAFKKIDAQLGELIKNHSNIAYILIIAGIISLYLGPYVPPVLRFVLFLSQSLQFVGLALLLFKPANRSKWMWFFGVMGFLAINSIIKGMFHDFFLWSVLLSSFVVMQLNLSMKGKLILIALGFMSATLVQTIKGQFRSSTEGLEDQQKVEIFTDMIGQQIDNRNEFEDQNSIDRLNVRLNQGWIISAIIDNIPKNMPYADGETISEAIEASLLPRFLAPNKKMAGGQENFRRFTGIGIRDDTSMGTSVLGEAYGNYGFTGAWIFMFIWGVFLALIFRILINYGKKKSIIIVFIPLIFLQVIKAETELYVVLNHLVKSLIFVTALLFLLRKVLKWQI